MWDNSSDGEFMLGLVWQAQDMQVKDARKVASSVRFVLALNWQVQKHDKRWKTKMQAGITVDVREREWKFESEDSDGG